MTYAEAVKEAEYWFPQCDESAMDALAVLTKLAEENERLRAKDEAETDDITEMLEEAAGKHIKNLMKIGELEKENATLKAEVENLQGQLIDYAWLNGELIGAKKKAEAELSDVRSMNKEMLKLLDKRQAELDAARPLLEAVKADKPDSNHGYLCYWAVVDREIIAYRERKGEGKNG